MSHKSKGAAVLFLVIAGTAAAQDIEPRRWTPLPIGTNVVGAGYAHTDAEIFVDPVLKLEDARMEADTTLVSYLHAFDFLGNSARVDVQVPHVSARWKGVLDGVRRSTGRTGLGDPRLRLSVNFLGAPALGAKELRAYRVSRPVSTVAGAALSVRVPLGEYQKHKLLNLGQNRFVIRPQLGIVRTRGHWSYELTGSAYLFTDNNEFRGSRKREQDLLFTLQGHLVYSSPAGWWASLSAALDSGGESSVGGERRDDRRREFLYGISAGMAVNPRAGLKLAYVGSRTQKDIGLDSDNLVLALTFRF